MEMSVYLFFVALCLCTSDTDSAPSEGDEVDKRAPWHVDIYTKTQKRQICGGTLVSKTEVISAAHCFWSEDFGPQSPVQFAVSAGHRLRPGTDPGNGYAQHFDVAEIIFPDRFNLGSYQDDIAIVKLSRSIKFSPYVYPICVEFNEELEKEQLKNGEVGMLAAWGLKEDEDSNNLDYMKLPLVNNSHCVKETETYAVHTLQDKICAGDQQNKYICGHAGGNGLTYTRNDISYLKGVSTARKCHKFTYTTFTNIRLHRTFLRHNIEGLEVCREEKRWDSDDDDSFMLISSILIHPGILLIVFFFVFVMGVYACKRNERRQK